MSARPLKHRVRRQVRKSQRQVEDLGTQAGQGVDRHLLRRFGRLQAVRRFVIAWVGLFVLLIAIGVWQLANLSSYYQSLQPVPGGIYNEGILGTFTNANPLYATGSVDSAISHLIFGSLFTYDDHNRLVGELAKSYSVDDRGVTYTVHLRPGLTWQDGKPLTANDVVFTYKTIQNPDAQSPLTSSWQGIAIAATDAQTVTFTLPNALASFPYNLTNGIVPEHILGKMPAGDLRSEDFNTQHPIGSGPFSWLALQVSGSGPKNAQEHISLAPFAHFALGAPKLKEFIVHAYANSDQLLSDYQNRQLTAVAGLDTVPMKQAGEVHSFVLSAGTYVFFKTSSPILSDTKVRQALVQASDPASIIAKLGYQTRPVHEPLLEGQLGYDRTYAQATGNLAGAKSLLDQAGWAVGADGLRSKGGQQLAFTLTAADTPEYRLVTTALQQQWKPLGIKLKVDLQSQDDFSANLSDHSQYDAILYGIAIGSDPDVFVYWDSSQIGPLSANLNLSEYKSATADGSLETGRTRLDPNLRTVKYKPFLQAWQQDAPALGLYQPRFLYLTNQKVYHLSDHVLNNETDRFNNVQNWEIRTAKVTD